MAIPADAACPTCGGPMKGAALRSIPPSLRFTCKKCGERMIVVSGQAYKPYNTSEKPAPQHKIDYYQI